MKSRSARGKAGPTRPAPIAIAWLGRPRPLSDAKARKVARAALRLGKRAGAPLSLVFVDDRTLARMHGRWLGDSRPTDVISFDLGNGGRGPVGELYISVQRAVRVARERGVPAERELALYIAHGCLHLCGFDDHSTHDRRAMRVAERSVLAELGFADDPNAFE